MNIVSTKFSNFVGLKALIKLDSVRNLPVLLAVYESRLDILIFHSGEEWLEIALSKPVFDTILSSIVLQDKRFNCSL